MSKPFLKWAGGKSKLVPFIESNLPAAPRKRLVEPFCGSCAVSLGLEFESYLLADANADLINLYKSVISDKQDFIEYVRTFFCEGNKQEYRFYELRNRFNESADIHERSALFMYLNRHAFNGLCRYNSKGYFNAPFGRYKTVYFPETEMENFINRASRIELMQGDFEVALAKSGQDDLVYCDPPYVPLSQTASFTAYAKGSFGYDDQVRLADCIKKIAVNTKGVLISNHDTELTRVLYAGAEIKTIAVQRNISANGANRTKANEILAIFT